MPICSQRARIFGSFCGRFAFMGKAVLGRITVIFSSSGTRWGSPKGLIFHYRERGKRRPFRAGGSTEVVYREGLVKVLSKNEKKSVQFSPGVVLAASNLPKLEDGTVLGGRGKVVPSGNLRRLYFIRYIGYVYS